MRSQFSTANGRYMNMSVNKCIGVVGAAHDESLQCLAELAADGGVSLRLYGNRASIESTLSRFSIISSISTIIESSDDIESAAHAARDTSQGLCHVLMKGCVHTSDFIKGVLDKEFQLLDEESILSHVARLKLPGMNKPMLITDAAINISPNLDRKVSIIRNAVSVARSTGIDIPKVALVCPVETVTPKMTCTTDAAQIVFLQHNTSLFGDVVVEGPFALDVALSKHAAEVKRIGGIVPGNPDILMFHSIDSANATLKAFTVFREMSYAGIVFGAKIPIVLTSRSDSAETRLESVRLALAVSG